MTMLMQHWELQQDAHKTQTYNICKTKTLISPIHEHLQLHSSQYKQNTTSLIQTYNILQHSKAKTYIVSRHLAIRGNNKILHTRPPHISSSEEILARLTRCTLAQRRTNRSPFLKSYLHSRHQITSSTTILPL